MTLLDLEDVLPAISEEEFAKVLHAVFSGLYAIRSRVPFCFEPTVSYMSVDGKTLRVTVNYDLLPEGGTSDVKIK